ncbi:TetR family transcriptional regulator [Flavitalea sp.]|nr:TetR family transcriptional regulator [Flavitalea sp.]
MGRASKKEIRQKEIIEGYYKVAKLEGLENTSIAKIAKETDINPSLIIHYFQTKDDLTKGLIGHILDKYSEIYHVPPSRKATRLTRLKFVIDSLISNKWDDLVDNGIYFSGYALVFRDQVVKEQYKAMHDQLRSILTALIQDCIDHDEVIVKDSRKAAQLIYMMVDGAYFYLSLINDKKEFEQKLVLFRQHAYQFLGI